MRLITLEPSFPDFYLLLWSARAALTTSVPLTPVLLNAPERVLDYTINSSSYGTHTIEQMGLLGECAPIHLSLKLRRQANFGLKRSQA